MAENRETRVKPDSPLETPTDTTGGKAEPFVERDAARNGNAGADINQAALRQTAEEAVRQRDIALDAVRDVTRERDLADAAASRLASERNAAATVAEVESSIAGGNAFGFWMMVAIVAAILAVGVLWAAANRPWESRERDLNTAQPPPAATAAPGATTGAPSSGAGSVGR